MGRQLLFVIFSWNVGNSNITAMTHIIADLAFSLASVLILGIHMRFHLGHEYLTGHISTYWCVRPATFTLALSAVHLNHTGGRHMERDPSTNRWW